MNECIRDPNSITKFSPLTRKGIANKTQNKQDGHNKDKTRNQLKKKNKQRSMEVKASSLKRLTKLLSL